MKILLLLYICFFLLVSCRQPRTGFEKKKTRYFQDDTSFRKMKCGLYINIAGKIAYRDFDKPQCDSCDGYFGYISKACYAIRVNSRDEECEYRELQTFIDTNSLIFLNDLYFKDKSNVFYFHDMQEGGMLYRIAAAHPSTFKIFAKFSQQFGYDRKNYFHGNQILTQREVRELGLDTQKLK